MDTEKGADDKKIVDNDDLTTQPKKPGKFDIEKLDERIVPDDVALHSDNNQI